MKVLLQHLFNDAADGKGRRSQVLWSRVLSVTACPRGQCFSMLFNAFHCFFNAFQCFFNDFQCFFQCFFTMGRRRVPKLARVGTRWHAAPHCKLSRTPLERAHLAWALPPRRTGGPHPCARSPKRARTLPEPSLSTAGHALRRKTHSRMLRTRFHEVICDTTP